MPQKQSWRCEKCKATGSVEYEPHAGVCEVLYLLTDSHAAVNPECDGGTAYMRIGNPDEQPTAPAAPEWQPMKTAPRTSMWIMVRLEDGTEVKAHYACDLTGEEQPPFEGWFKESGKTSFVGVDPVEWRPL